MRSRRTLTRGNTVLAGMILVSFLGTAALMLNSTSDFVRSESQVAATLAQNTVAMKKCPDGSYVATNETCPSEATKPPQKCINNNIIHVEVSSTPGAKPNVVTRVENKPPAGTPDKKGCFVSFCATTAPTSGSPRTICTSPRYYDGDEALNKDSADNGAANTNFAQGLVASVEAGDMNVDYGLSPNDLQGLPSDTTKAVFSAFKEQGDAWQVSLSETQSAMKKAAEENLDLTGLEEIQKEQLTQIIKFDSYTKALGGTTGVVTPTPKDDGKVTTPEEKAPEQKGGQTTFDQNKGLGGLFTGQGAYSQRGADGVGGLLGGQQQCSGLMALFGGCQQGGLGGLGGLLGGQQQQQHCVVSQYPLIVQPYPAQPGCLNYNPQQQCGLITQLFGKCPSPNQNPNSSGGNPANNPYGSQSCSITASPASISAPGQAVTLTWRSQGNAHSAVIYEVGTRGPNGSAVVYPQTSTNYTMTVFGQAAGEARCEAYVTVGGSGTGGQTPHAQISCQPMRADVGMQVAIAYSCANATTSSGNGFTTNGALSGSATATISSQGLGLPTQNLTLTCSKDGVTHSAGCEIQVNKPVIIFVSNPKQIKAGETANVGWVTSGMQSCVVSSPSQSGFTSENASNASPSGVAKTPPLTEDTQFVLTCTTGGGNTKTAELTVDVK